MPANRLALEKSPYLLQHANNPVDWFPWGQEAFDKAAREGKPVFLSVGYSTCHWCHVMEHESFEDAKTAELLNADFIAVKVDREERPDLDAIYMNYVQATTGSGGWPMSVFLTPDRKPFYGGTYFPPEPGFGRPGFKQLLNGIAEAWKSRRSEIERSAESAAQFLKNQGAAAGPGTLSVDLLKGAEAAFASRFDAELGGFGGAPKFPMPHVLSLLLRCWKRSEDLGALKMVTKTLDAMAAGGLYDRVGGGFHRYSTDAAWRVPHFEKMLYDQAMLATAYLEAYQALREARYAAVARETLDYVLRDMTHGEGGFFSAEDADSADEKGQVREGAFYECTPEQRAKLSRPHRDDKVLTDWNGLMIAAFAMASRVLDDARYGQAASKAARFLLAKMRMPDGGLFHRWRDGQAAVEGQLDDYAFFIRGLLALHQASLDAQWLDEAARLARLMIERFFGEGGFYRVADGVPDLIARPREFYDGAVPSGNSMAALDLALLSRLTGDKAFEKAARTVLEACAGSLAEQPAGHAQMLIALDLFLEPPLQITLSADTLDETAKGMIKEIYSRFLPNRVLRLERASGVTTATVCRDLHCELPVKTPRELAQKLGGNI